MSLNSHSISCTQFNYKEILNPIHTEGDGGGLLQFIYEETLNLNPVHTEREEAGPTTVYLSGNS